MMCTFDMSESQSSTTSNSSASEEAIHSNTDAPAVVEIVQHAHQPWKEVKSSKPTSFAHPLSRLKQRVSPSGGPIARFARRAATVQENSPVLSRLNQMAGELVARSSQDIINIGITSTNAKNRQSITAIGLATTWARWGHRTLLVCAGSSSQEFGRSFCRTTPSFGQLASAVMRGDQLPAPQVMTNALSNLEIIAGMDGLSLAQIQDNGVLHQMTMALRQRYDRIIWSLPFWGLQEWSPAVLKQTIDSIMVSACRGHADLRKISQIATELEDLGMPPLQITWHE